MRCLRLAVITIFASGCQLLLGLDDSNPRDGDNGGRCYGTDIEVCFDAPLTQIIGLTGPIDTGTQAGTGASPDCLAYSGRDAGLFCVIAGQQLTIPAGATVSVSGSRPLVLIADQAMQFDGTLDAAAHASPRRQGPGADVAVCPMCLSAPGAQGGGTGGSFGEAGAVGGQSGGDLGGGLCGVPDVTSFRAGCAGQNGGTADAQTGAAGGGGGAVYLIAGTALKIDGTATVDVSGAGGTGGRCTVCDGTNGSAYGGGGGGSGGMLVLESPIITVIGRVYADGGGGGEGASHATNGMTGADPDGLVAAPGGATGGTFHGGAGGSGGHVDASPNVGNPGTASPPGGGGGGGGGVGIIHVIGTLTGSVSPNPT